MDNKTYFRMKSMALGFGKSRGLSCEAAEDMAHDWIVKVAVKGLRQSLFHAYVDYIRREFGRTVTKQHLEFKDDMLGSYQISESYLIDLNPEKLLNILGEKRYRLIIMMVDGCSFEEKCQSIGISETCIHKHQVKIKKAINEILDTNLSLHRTNASCYRKSKKL